MMKEERQKVIYGDKNGQCRLCHTYTNLCKSHIIPEFFFKPMYDLDHEYYIMTNDLEKPTQTNDIGIREYLLCSKCEAFLNRYENYVSKLFFGGCRFQSSATQKEYTLSGVDYAKLKLCFLSILWRMSVAVHPFFKAVHLGPHGEVVRQMILNGDPGASNKYGFVCIIPHKNGQVLSPIILQPTCVNSDGHHTYRTVIGGLLFLFYISSHPPNPLFEHLFLQSDGKWTMVAEEIHQITFLHDWLVETAQKDSLRKS
jgi:hypothetical protein